MVAQRTTVVMKVLKLCMVHKHRHSPHKHHSYNRRYRVSLLYLDNILAQLEHSYIAMVRYDSRHNNQPPPVIEYNRQLVVLHN